MIPVILWLRVSDGAQNEMNQLPDLERYCAEHGYRVVRTMFVHGKSAWKAGRLDKDKAAVLADLRAGLASVVVAWSVDRWSRGGIADLLDGMQAVKNAGGRVEFVKDSALNAEGPAQELLLAVLAWVARWESEHKSDRVKNGMARRRAQGAIMGGSVPLGYRLAGGVRVREAAALAVVREVFERSARGESTATIAAFIRRAGYKRRDNTVADILRNPFYVADKVVSGALARAAVQALEGRRTGPVRRVSEPDYSGVFRCRCGKVMHRIMAGGMPGKGVEPTRYYRCRGHEGKPVPMVRADDADALIEYAIGTDPTPWLIPNRIGGDTRDADIARLRAELPAAKTRAETDAIWDQIDAVAAREPEPERTVWVPSGRTRGEHWQELTIAERRAWLESEGVTITAWRADPGEGGTWARGRVRMAIVAIDPHADEEAAF